MRLRLLPSTLTLAVLVVSGCGLPIGEPDPGEVLMSEDADPQDVADAWVEVACVEDPVRVTREFEDAEITLSCPNEETDPDLPEDPDPADLPETNDLSVFADPDDTTESDSDDCDVPYMVLGGPLWTARVYYGEGQTALLDLGAEVICEGG